MLILSLISIPTQRSLECDRQLKSTNTDWQTHNRNPLDTLPQQITHSFVYKFHTD